MLVLALWAIIRLQRLQSESPAVEVETLWTVEREVYVDTIPYYKPVAKDSVVVRYETVKLPKALDRDTITADTLREKRTEGWLLAEADSVEVEIPIGQKVYEGEQYRAYVSGYAVEMDSIFVFPRTEVVTLTETQTITKKERAKPFGIGAFAGYGYGPRGFQPVVGVGISWTPVRF